MAKQKTPIYEKGQFSGHLIFYKKLFFRRKKIVYADKQEPYFFEKKHFSFFLKKIVLGNFFSKKLKKKFINFLWAENFLKFSKKRKMLFFKKIKFLFIGVNKYFSPKKTFFVKN